MDERKWSREEESGSGGDRRGDKRGKVDYTGEEKRWLDFKGAAHSIVDHLFTETAYRAPAGRRTGRDRRAGAARNEERGDGGCRGKAGEGNGGGEELSKEQPRWF